MLIDRKLSLGLLNEIQSPAPLPLALLLLPLRPPAPTLSLFLLPHPSKQVTGSAANSALVIKPTGTFQSRANHLRND